ncbi:MAG TPA: helix-turn-helix domain-containing protein, partial [Novosphingobium sp.]|nr:helix-turn-helix domain-containing protein [Novosphingobium sp.]
MGPTSTSARKTRNPGTRAQGEQHTARGPVQSRSRQTLDGILLAATALFKEAGPPALTFAGIAKAAGVSVGAVQFHFANKEAILEAVITRILDDNLQAEIVLYEQLAGAGGGMSAFLHAYICGQHELLARFNPHFAKSIEIIRA